MPEPAAHDPHRRRDIAHSLTVAALACVLSLGLVYLAYLVQVVRVARRAGCTTGGAGRVLVFGKQLVDGGPDAEFERRLARAASLAAADPGLELVVLGGGEPGGPTEADVGAARLQALGVAPARIRREDRSRDTLENLRNARGMLDDPAAPLALLSNRYHLARCLALARQLGLTVRACAAESGFDPSQQRPGLLAREAALLCWLDIGTRWARLIGHRRMLARVL